jgi:hypothetical protein
MASADGRPWWRPDRLAFYQGRGAQCTQFSDEWRSIRWISRACDNR